jgi:uncharacterized lipoprotein YmbA
MPYQIMCRTYVCLIVTGILMTYGCARTPPARFYILQPQPAVVDQKQPSESGNDLFVGVGPVELPEHLNRPQMVTRTGSSEIHLSEFNRWAESLEKNFTRVLAENISVHLLTDNILVYPWVGAAKIKRQVRANIIQFDSVPGKEVLLKVHWALMGEDGENMFVVKKSSFSAPAGKGYPEMVEAMNRVLNDFSREIAKEIKNRDTE